MIGEIRVHRRTGEQYVYDFTPPSDEFGDEKPRWLRLKPLDLGQWQCAADKVAPASELTCPRRRPPSHPGAPGLVSTEYWHARSRGPRLG